MEVPTHSPRENVQVQGEGHNPRWLLSLYLSFHAWQTRCTSADVFLQEECARMNNLEHENRLIRLMPSGRFI